MLEGMGIETGVDLYKLIECVWMAEEMVDHPLWGHVSKSGLGRMAENSTPWICPSSRLWSTPRHFIKGPAAYKDAPSPWKEAIKSPQRPETMSSNGDSLNEPVSDPSSSRWLPS